MKICIVVPWVLSNKQLIPSKMSCGSSGAEETLINLTTILEKNGATTNIYYNGLRTEEYAFGANWLNLERLNRFSYYDAVIIWNDYRETLEPLMPKLPKAKCFYVRFVNQLEQNEFNWLATSFDIVLSQSEWLIKKYSVNSANIMLCRNGINAEEYSCDNHHYMRSSNTFIYGSEYDRGLLYLLKIWPIVTAVNPQFKLKVFHGWDVFDSKMKRLKPESSGYGEMLRFKTYMTHLLTTTYGVKELGRVSHTDVINLARRSRALLYPCLFPENCSTLSLKVQAAGCDIVAISSGGLVETLAKNCTRTREILWSTNSLHQDGNSERALSEFTKLLEVYLQGPVIFHHNKEVEEFINLHAYTNVFRPLLASLKRISLVGEMKRIAK